MLYTNLVLNIIKTKKMKDENVEIHWPLVVLFSTEGGTASTLGSDKVGAAWGTMGIP